MQEKRARSCIRTTKYFDIIARLQHKLYPKEATTMSKLRLEIPSENNTNLSFTYNSTDELIRRSVSGLVFGIGGDQEYNFHQLTI